MKQLSLFDENEPNKDQGAPPKRRKPSNPYLGPSSPSMGYEKYLKSEEWKSKRILAIKMAHYKCQRCGNKNNLEVHHKNYECLYHERLNDVEVLCTTCHPIADSEREYETAYETFAYKKYGDDYWKHDDERLQDEFAKWHGEKDR